MLNANDAVKRKRRELGLSQLHAAVRCGMHPSRLSTIENGAATPTIEQAVAIQRVLGIPVEAWVVAPANANQPAAAAGAR